MKKSLFLVVLAVLVAVFAVSCDGESAAAEPKRFTVKFDLRGGTSAAIDDQTVVEGEKAKEPVDPTRADHEFKGWTLEGADFDFNTPITKDITLVASWGGVTSPDPEPETKYTVTFDYDDDGATANLKKEVDKDSKVEKPTEPTREGYAFKGWYIVNETEEKKFEFTTPITENLELKAKWVEVYTVTFDVDDSTVSTQKVEDGNTATKPEDPTKTDYRFKYWTLDDSEFNFNTPITEDITLKAEWAKVHTVTFDVDGGTTVSAQNVEDGNKATKPENPTKTGYRFDCWKHGDDVFAFETTLIKENITLKASWVKTYTVTFKTGSNYASPVASITVDDGSTIADIPEPKRPGWGFDVWKLGDSVFDFNTSITGDINLTASWIKLFNLVDGAIKPVSGMNLENVEIPESIDGKDVTSIKEGAFQNNKIIKTVTIPSTLTEIGDNAFNGCTNITSVTFVGDSNLDRIGKNAFETCVGIRSFAIPASVTEIDNDAFNGCSSITSVTFGTDSKLATIGVLAFSNCSGITSLEIPISVTTIGYGAFKECDSMTEIVIPSSVTSVGSYAFAYCDKIESVKIFSNGGTTYGTYVFTECPKLDYVDFNDMSSPISDYMFYKCGVLEDTSIPKGVKSIGKYAFAETKLGSIIIAADATYGESAFPSTCNISRYPADSAE